MKKPDTILTLLFIGLLFCASCVSNSEQEVRPQDYEEHIKQVNEESKTDEKATSTNGQIVLEGHYYGKNVYVQNPMRSSGEGFCVYDVVINGSVSTKLWGESSAFEINLAKYGLQVGDPVVIVIEHHTDCLPKVLNPSALYLKETIVP